MSELNGTLSKRKRATIVLIGSLLGATAMIVYLSVRNSDTTASRPNEMKAVPTLANLEEVKLPPGPHLAEFQASCFSCHSARLVMSQPILPREKWVEVVHKMVAVYGAPMTPEKETQVVDYMVAAQADR